MATKLTPRRAATGRGPALQDGHETRPRPQVWLRVYRHHLRVLRNTAIAWIVVLAGIGTGVVATYEDRLPTEAERAAADALEGVPAFEAVFGRFVQPGSLEGFVLSRWTGMFAIFVAVWGMLGATKLLRGAEEAGHTEPLRAGSISPRGLLAPAVAAMLTWFAIFALTVGVTHSAAGMDTATSWALGGAMGLLAASFAAIGTLSSQMATPRRRATQLAGAVLAAALVVRIAAAVTATPDWVWWTTPFGWIGFLHQSDAARPAVFTAFVSLVTLLFAAAFALAARDLHASHLGHAPTSPSEPRPVGGQLGLTARLTGAAALGWALVLATIAFVFALLADEFVAAVGDMPEATAIYEQMGYTALHTSEGFVALILGWFFFAGVALFSAAQAAAIREEEASWRIEHLLARPLGRVRWLTTRTLAAAVGIVLIAAAVGVAVWVGTALGGTALPVGDALLAGVNLIPAALLFLGLGILLYGLAPRLTAPLAFGVVIAAYLLDFVGPLLELPVALLDVSPFRHLAEVPVADLNVPAALTMLAIAATAATAGITAFRHRDLKEA
jgi:ABC-2 type transport system permease protein